ncbi:hypothetical protein [Paractinoplanes durhamensis]|uniref:Lipoprotein n=1 Tax=Paractinoplanes durhamensis TaxID=113563 RepID=A0ABQ3YPE0_9ACTN|nr:hypothetical protein [Actinoplanes durhamensis]GID99444.1 hypothetical protein Adu01nite_07950 [Actinoplanes durhamensis]
MTTLRGTVAVAALAALLGLGMSGCSVAKTDAGATSDDKTAAADPGPSGDAQAALAAATKALSSGNYTFVVASPTLTAEGIVHLPSESAELTIDTGSAKFEIVLAEPDRWVRLSTGLAAGAGPDTWFHVDSSEIKEGGDLAFYLTDPDVIDVSALFDAVTEARLDANTITGTIDGTRVNSPDGFLDDATIKAMGSAAASLPFTATVDTKGRLAELDIEAPAAGKVQAGKWVFTVSGYGEQEARKKPAGQIRDLPPSGYAKLNG